MSALLCAQQQELTCTFRLCHSSRHRLSWHRLWRRQSISALQAEDRALQALELCAKAIPRPEGCFERSATPLKRFC